MLQMLSFSASPLVDALVKPQSVARPRTVVRFLHSKDIWQEALILPSCSRLELSQKVWLVFGLFGDPLDWPGYCKAVSVCPTWTFGWWLRSAKTRRITQRAVVFVFVYIPILLWKLLTVFFSTRITIVVHEIFRPPQESKTASFFNSPQRCQWSKLLHCLHGIDAPVGRCLHVLLIAPSRLLAPIFDVIYDLSSWAWRLTASTFSLSLVTFCTDVSWGRPVSVSSYTVVFIYEAWSYLI